MVYLVFLLSFSAFSKTEQVSQAVPADEDYRTPVPHGDTRMGADAAGSGTDITDQDVQEQEDKKAVIKWGLESDDLPIEEQDDLESVQK
jgi:hypothetical protein